VELSARHNRPVSNSVDEPPSLRPMRRNAVLLLYDAPLYRDWAFWLTASLAVLTGWAIGTSPPSPGIPLWLVTSLAVLFFTTVGGIIPAAFRLQLRKWRWRWRQAHTGVRSKEPPRGDQPKHGPSHVEAPSPARIDRPSVRATGPRQEAALPPHQPTVESGVGAGAPEASANVFPLSKGNSQAESVDALSQARLLLPYPAARAARSISLAANPKEQYEGILDTGEALTLTLGLTAAAWARAEAPGLEALARLQTAYTGRGLSQGHWHDLIREVAKLSVNNPFALPGLAENVRGGSGLVNDLRTILAERNRWAHGARPHDNSEAAVRVAEFQPPLERALMRSLFLANTPWVLVKAVSYRRTEGQFRVLGNRAMGDHPEFERIDLDSKVPLADDNFYALGPRGPIDMSPLVVMRYCPTCRQPEAFYADRTDPKQGVSLKSFGRGHVIFDPTLEQELSTIAGAVAQ
jgi:hypothetical protein